MCNPVAFVAASAALQLVQQQEQADQINKAADVQEANIHRATAQNYNQLNRQGVEEAQNQAVEQNRLSREVAARVATGRAQAGGSGVTGISVQSMLLDLAGKGLEAKATSETNYARTVAANADQATEIEMNAKGQLGSVQRAPGVGLMDVVGAGLKIGSAYTAQQVADKRATMGTGAGSITEQRAAARASMGLKP